jgi:hypothetical protein
VPVENADDAGDTAWIGGEVLGAAVMVIERKVTVDLLAILVTCLNDDESTDEEAHHDD